MNLNRPYGLVPTLLRRALQTACVLAAICLAGASVPAQTIKQTFPASKNVRIQLSNSTGRIIVEGWERNEIKLVAEREAPVAKLVPQMSGEALILDVKNQNRGRSDIGNVNFKLMVPNGATVDIETGQGDISVKDINGSMVRAHVWLGGDIELLNLQTANVMAANTTGDIVFDGLLTGGGKYEFKSTQGNINIRIPGDSSFVLNAVSPDRDINLGAFDNGRLKQNDSRKAYGPIGQNANTSLIVANQKGRIAFIKR